MFDFFKKDKDETVKKTDTFIEIACLLIHASKIDEIYTEEEKKIIKKMVTTHQKMLLVDLETSLLLLASQIYFLK